MQYDQHWTPQERARVEALRLLDARGKFGASEAAEFGEACVRAAKPLAEFIAGPEARYPYPWDKSTEARKKLDEIMWRGPDGKRVSTRMGDTEIIVTYAELSEVLYLIPDGEQAPF